MSPDWSRRETLCLSSIGLTASAGCLGRLTGRTDSPCGEDLTRLPKMYDELRYGTLGEFELTAEPNRASPGEKISFTLRWVQDNGDGSKTTGSSWLYTVENKTESGWQSIHHVPKRRGWTEEGRSATKEATPPKTFFDWSLTLTQQGMERSPTYNPPYTVCEPLQPGVYRFVYWGAPRPQDGEGDREYAIGVKFHVEE